jgi:hypothetical protein
MALVVKYRKIKLMQLLQDEAELWPTESRGHIPAAEQGKHPLSGKQKKLQFPLVKMLSLIESQQRTGS